MTSRLTLVDLAGSERLKKSAQAGPRGDADSARTLAKEAMSINKSLSFLEQVVVALGRKGHGGHVPHRSCKLTAVLRESLGGNCKTLLVANVWPEQRHMEETLSTLKFAARMQSVTNMAAINSQAEVSPAAALAACQAQLTDLKRELAMHDQLAGRAHVSYDPLTDGQRAELKVKVRAFLEGDNPASELEAPTLRQIKESFELFRELYREQGAQLRSATDAAAAATAAATRAARTSSERMGSASGGARPAAAGADGADGADGGVVLSAEVEASPPVEVVDFVGGAESGGADGGFACGVAPTDSRPADPQYRTAARASVAPGALGALGGAPIDVADPKLLPAEGARWLLRVRARLPFPPRTPAARTAMYLRAASSVAFYVFLPPPYALRRLAWQRTGRGSRCRGPCRTRRCSRYSTCYTLTASSITHPTVIRCMRNVLYCSGTTCAQADSVKLWQGYAAPAPQQQHASTASQSGRRGTPRPACRGRRPQMRRRPRQRPGGGPHPSPAALRAQARERRGGCPGLRQART